MSQLTVLVIDDEPHHKQYLHVYMGHLRNKLERGPAKPRFLVTEPGVGYRLRAD